MIILNHTVPTFSESLFAIDREIEGKALFSPSITPSHLQIMAKWFRCRIGIFVNGKWTKYGSWTATDSDVPTMLIQQQDNGKYAPILSLK
uniref:Uncharacterized protein n=1 Tax=Panagrolaimus superbus TaxID=310955 RepID=A0A914XS04_9BILA